MAQPSKMLGDQVLTGELATLIPQLIAHLQQADQALDVSLASVREVHQALLQNDADSLSESLERQARVVQAGEPLASRRAELLKQIAGELQIPSEALTLNAVVEAAPSDFRDQLEALRSRLQEKAEEERRINDQNTAMLAQSVELTQNVLDELTYRHPSGEAYGADGRKHGAASSSIIEASG